MKKIFLSLLAALGMVVGMTLTSCGGGGGANDISISGLTIRGGGSIPNFLMEVGERYGQSGMYAAQYSFGKAIYTGTFSLTEGPSKDADANTIIIKGKMGIDNTACLTDSDFMAWLSGKSDALSVQVNSPIELTITVGEKDSGTMVRDVNALYYYKVDQSFPVDTPVEYGRLYIDATRLRKEFGIDNK